MKRVDINSNKNFYNILFVILICGFFLGVPNYVIRDILLNNKTQGWYLLIWATYVSISILYGLKLYKKMLAKDIAVLEYLRKHLSVKQSIHLKVGNINQKHISLQVENDMKDIKTQSAFSSNNELSKKLDNLILQNRI